MSKSVTYVGPTPADGSVIQFGEFGDPAGVTLVVTGDTVDLPDAVADELVDRGDAIHASATGHGEPPQSATKDEWSAYRAAQGWDIDGLTKQELIDLPDTP